MMCFNFVRVPLSWSTIEQLTCKQLLQKPPFMGVLQHSCSWKVPENLENNLDKSFRSATLLPDFITVSFSLNFPEIMFLIFDFFIFLIIHQLNYYYYICVYIYYILLYICVKYILKI